MIGIGQQQDRDAARIEEAPNRDRREQPTRTGAGYPARIEIGNGEKRDRQDPARSTSTRTGKETTGKDAGRSQGVRDRRRHTGWVQRNGIRNRHGASGGMPAERPGGQAAGSADAKG
jgi:hypothetical protein